MEIRGSGAIEQFHISPVPLLMAMYSNEFGRPFYCPCKADQGFTFCPEPTPHGENKLIFMGSRNVNEKVMLDLDDNCSLIKQNQKEMNVILLTLSS